MDFIRLPLNGKTDLSFVDGDFTPLPYTKGSSWCLANMNGELLFGHHDGAYALRAGRSRFP